MSFSQLTHGAGRADGDPQTRARRHRAIADSLLNSSSTSSSIGAMSVISGTRGSSFLQPVYSTAAMTYSQASAKLAESMGIQGAHTRMNNVGWGTPGERLQKVNGAHLDHLQNKLNSIAGSRSETHEADMEHLHHIGLRHAAMTNRSQGAAAAVRTILNAKSDIDKAASARPSLGVRLGKRKRALLR